MIEQTLVCTKRRTSGLLSKIQGGEIQEQRGETWDISEVNQEGLLQKVPEMGGVVSRDRRSPMKEEY